jgi:pancreatic triacylglycerol lipase
VDWSVGAQTNNYITARNRVGPAGQVVGQFIDWLNQNDFLRHSDVNIIGHSLGGHVAGHSGKNTLRGKVRAIFGTDPAGPLFTVQNPNDRFDIGDAEYTESILTNAGVLGFDMPVTHATFYPNWGSSQPGCGIDVGGGCAHGRATWLYSESVNSNCFVSRQCAGYDDIVNQNCPGTGVTAILGGDSAKPNVSGVFFLETNAASPFAMC